MFKIEKNIELPDIRMTHKDKYPLSEMKVGDSFFVPMSNWQSRIKIKNVQSRIYAAIRNLKEKKSYTSQDIKFTMKKVDGGVRCWRVK